MSDDAQDKQHLPSGKRIADLRKKGNVMRSRDLTGGIVFLVSVSTLIFMAMTFKNQFANNFFSIYSSIGLVANGSMVMTEVMAKIFINNFNLLLPLFGIIFVSTLISPFLFGGWNFTLEAIRFKSDKLNPAVNLKRTFSPKHVLVEIGKSFIKCLVILGALVVFIMNKKDIIISLLTKNKIFVYSMMYSIMKEFLILLSVCLIFLIAFDVLYNYFSFLKQAKMSTQELKDENKESEGSPDVKRKINMQQMMLYKQRLSTFVPKAHVIVTNPTHYAVALRYDENKDRAPKVVAKGKAYIADQIRLLATANGIPFYEAPGLARAIYHTTKQGAEIHPELYRSVAIVLTYVHQLKNYQHGLGSIPNFVSEFKLPDEFIYDE